MSPDYERSEAFLDTSVLMGYADRGEQDAARVITGNHSCSPVCSEFVREEFSNIIERRNEFIRDCRQYINQSEEGETVPPGRVFDEIDENDEEFVMDCINDLRGANSDTEALRLLRGAVAPLERAFKDLFEADQAYISIPTIPSRNSTLVSEMVVYIENRPDCCVLCDCVAWTRTVGTGTFVTSDSGDFFDDDINQEEDPDSEVDDGALSESLDDFFADSRSLQERINDKISQYCEEDVSIVIVETGEFVDQI